MTRNVLEWLERAAQRSGEKSAFVMPGETVTWAELKIKAGQIGSMIARRLPAQSPVLIIMEKSPACIATMMGVVSAGCFYTPLDSSMPAARMKMIADTLEPGMIICEETFLETASQLTEKAIIVTTHAMTENREIDEQLLARRRAGQIDDDLLYVLFTSGSTGVPKGVSITHRSVIDFIEWAVRALKLDGDVKFGSQAPFYFDNSVLDIYCSMYTGGSLFLISKGDFLFPKKLLATLQREEINTIFWVPSALVSFAESGLLTEGCLPALKRVFFCGEVMPCRALNVWKKGLPDADYVNMYGPTEITDVCSYYRIDREFADTDALPIGRACANTRIDLIDGEICVSGTCLSPGYYNAPEKTAAAFVPNPLRRGITQLMYRTGDLGEWNERGELMFQGRRDSQIKKSGFRIELGEIECAISAVPGVQLAACLYDAKTEKISAVYTGSIDEKEIRRNIKKAVPRYMLPDVYVHVHDMPRTGSGKIDRKTLKDGIKNGDLII